mmetsp:Transcript_11275/g.25880  ORF Transcript_11275/g.25880 Transcript_11275/m.25880 type:complete len:202 (+) Transcript_11275:112-717(+)
MLQPAIFFYATLTLFLLQIFLGQFDSLPWLDSSMVVPMPWWLFALLLLMFWVPQGFEAAVTNKPLIAFLAFVGGLSIGALVWYWGFIFKIALVVSFGVSNSIDRIVLPAAADVFRWRPPMSMLGAIVAIVGRHAATHGFIPQMFLLLFIFIALPSVGISLVDEATFFILRQVLGPPAEPTRFAVDEQDEDEEATKFGRSSG